MKAVNAEQPAMAPIWAYRKLANDMLKRWGKEVLEGNSKPNVLAGELSGEGGSWAPPQGAMFTPLAERCDHLFKELRELDPRMSHYLVARAVGLSYRQIAENMNISLTKVQREMESSFSAFTIAVYYKTRS